MEGKGLIDMEGEELIEKLIWLSVFSLFAVGLIFLIEKGIDKEVENVKNRKEQIISYMEKAGTGVVLGKSLNKNGDTEVAIQFKDTILYSENKEWYYLLKEGDSIRVKEGRLLKQ